MRDVRLSGGSLLALVVSVTAMVVALTSPFADATYTPAKSTITLTGIGSAPACPSGWTEIVAQTAAGTFSPITSITGVTTQRNNIEPDPKFCVAGHDGNCSAPLVTTLASTGTATTYTYYYRVCEK